MQTLIDKKLEECEKQMILYYQMAKGSNQINNSLESLKEFRTMVDDRLKAAGKQLKIVSQAISEYDSAQAAMGEQGFRLSQGVQYYEGFCKLADKQILSGIDNDIERLELNLLESKRKQLQEMTKRMAQMAQETSPLKSETLTMEIRCKQAEQDALVAQEKETLMK